MTTAARVISDSISPQGIRLTTMQLRYPKFIHGEFMTHRVFSRNASSSRAIPIERLIQDVLDDPAMPVFWGKNRPGMQAVEELSGGELDAAILQWLTARNYAVNQARAMAKMSVHKQIVNRIIEPWCHINVIVTATDWANFYALRRHKDAQPEMKALADVMRTTHRASTPKLLQPGEWHLPYVAETHNLDWSDEITTKNAIRVSVARCARVSYLTHEGKPPNIDDDLKLYDRLVGSTPLHASPAEHQATPDGTVEGIGVTNPGWQHPEHHGNLRGWVQFRKTLANECVPE